LADSLKSLGVNLSVFRTERRSRGQTGAGDLIGDSIDPKRHSGCLYGSFKTFARPPESLKQDLRHTGCVWIYLYFHHALCNGSMPNNKSLIILDRPILGYIDGPVLIRHGGRSWECIRFLWFGMTAGELAQMINGEDG
jgi:uncharacterized protein YbbC (DUF1343 family)